MIILTGRKNIISDGHISNATNAAIRGGRGENSHEKVVFRCARCISPRSLRYLYANRVL
jgi:hypothetical protein